MLIGPQPNLKTSKNNSAQLLSISWFCLRYPSLVLASCLLHASITHRILKVFVFMFTLLVDCEFFEDAQFIVIPPGSRSLAFTKVLEFRTTTNLMFIECLLCDRHCSRHFSISFNSHNLLCICLYHPNLLGTET